MFGFERTSRPLQVKKAAALANMELGLIPADVGDAIVAACDTIIDGAPRFD